jgi:hypothetical protein
MIISRSIAIRAVLLAVVCAAVFSTLLSAQHMLYIEPVPIESGTTRNRPPAAAAGSSSTKHPTRDLPTSGKGWAGGSHNDGAALLMDDLHRLGTSRVVKASSLEQIHHGIYKTTSAHTDGAPLRFAFKTECRPAAKWHGQQGWGEIAVYNLLSLWEGFDGQYHDDTTITSTYRFKNSVPYAVGGIVLVTPEMLKNIVHRDQCGLMSSEQISKYITELSTTPEDGIAARAIQDLKSIDGTSLVPLMGVFLTWMPNVDDNAIPIRSLWLQDFVLPKPLPPQPGGGADSHKTVQEALDQSNKRQSESPPEEKFSKAEFLKTNALPMQVGSGGNGVRGDLRLEVRRQISDVMMFDFLLGNEDREEKNWFRDATTGRYILMDNGFVFSGRGYKESICSPYPSLLACPPLLRHLTKSGTCNQNKKHPSPSSPSAGLCVFRPETIRMIGRLSKQWLFIGRVDVDSSPELPSLAKKWLQSTKSDILLRYLTTVYASQSTDTYDVPLARFRHLSASTSPGSCGMLVESYPNVTIVSGPLSSTSTNGLELIALALQMRMERLLEHVGRCVLEFGGDFVFSSSATGV